MDATIVRQIDARLENIRTEHDVNIPLAIESGSRAWGFPSPDSDYDCRFIYLRPKEDYLSLWRKRDVIETPLEGLFDINGWDLAKALKLLLKGNAVVVEWLTSPISYVTDAQFRDELLAVAHEVVDRTLVARHYLHLGERQRRTYFRDDKRIPQKKIFYALRPAMALRWLRLHPSNAIAPMHFPTLLADSDAPVNLVSIVQQLIRRKAETRELEAEPIDEIIGGFIDAEFESAQQWIGNAPTLGSQSARLRCDAFFMATLDRQAR